MSKKHKVPGYLEELLALYQQRNGIYGDNYKRFGHLMLAFFPHGIKLETVEDFNRFAVFTHLATKLSRYAENFSNDGHHDSLMDLSLYAMLLRELDEGTSS